MCFADDNADVGDSVLFPTDESDPVFETDADCFVLLDDEGDLDDDEEEEEDPEKLMQLEEDLQEESPEERPTQRKRRTQQKQSRKKKVGNQKRGTQGRKGKGSKC